MKVENRMEVAQADLERLLELDASVRGTDKYTMYRMEAELKRKANGSNKWSEWKFLGFGMPLPAKEFGYSFKLTKDGDGMTNLYIVDHVSFDDNGDLWSYRWRVTDEVREALGWEVDA